MPFIFLWFTNCFHGCFFKRDFSDVVVMKTLRCNFLDVLRRTYCNIVGGFVEFQPLLRDELLFPIFSSSKVTLLMKAVGWIVVSSINTSRETIPLHNIGSTMFDAFLLHFLHCVILVRLCSQLCSSEKDLLNKWFDFAGLFAIRVVSSPAASTYQCTRLTNQEGRYVFVLTEVAFPFMCHILFEGLLNVHVGSTQKQPNNSHLFMLM